MTQDNTTSSVTQDADPEASESLALTITIKFGSISARYKINSDMSLMVAIRNFCDSQGLDLQSVRFLFDGERIVQQHTPGSLGMEEGDEIEGYQEQTGGQSSFVMER